MPKFSRRHFIGTTAVGTAALVAGSNRLLAAARKKIPIGVQLYSVRSVFPGDVPGTLAAIKKIGYDAVEFAGYASKDAKTLRQLLDDNGLKCCGTHTALPTLVGDALPKTIEFNETLGNPNLVVPSMPGAKTLEAWAKNAEKFDEIAEKLKPHKMRVGYHNHTMEFQPVEGQPLQDFFFGKASKDVFVQLDIGHCARAGADPVAYLKKFPGRVISVHVKEYSPAKRDALVGEGAIKWPEVFDACENVAGTQWYIIEEETGAYKGLEGIERSFQNLKKLLG
jgi:sugar phosphate isomerase/epimerase